MRQVQQVRLGLRSLKNNFASEKILWIVLQEFCRVLQISAFAELIRF